MDTQLITKKMLQENRKIHRDDQNRKYIQHWTQRICAEVVQASKLTDNRLYTWNNTTEKNEDIVPDFLIGKLVKSLEDYIEGCKIRYANRELTVDWS
jgi:hypothetical protein